MLRGRASLTARIVAVTRATAHRPSVPTGDHDAEDRLVRSLKLPLPLRWRPPGMGPYMRARTAFYDETLLRACESGTRQVVIVGAGYDGRALRFRQPGVGFFEVDHPVTQDDKQARLRRLQVDADDIRFVAVDLGHGSVPDAVAAAGHDPTSPTHFMCEGLTPYLPRSVLDALLRSLATVAAPGSTLAVDFAGASHGRGHLVSRVGLAFVRGSVAMLGEPMVTMLTAPKARVLLEATGWTNVELQPTSALLPVTFALASRGAAD